MTIKTPAPDTAAGLLSLRTLQKRPQFLATARGRKAASPAFILQARARDGEGTDHAGVGFTCSKKVGNAVARNRAKRRLREAARLVLPKAARSGWDYVLIGRAGATASRPFEDLCADLRRALDQVHANQTPPKP